MTCFTPLKGHSSLLCLKFHKKISIEKITNHRHCLVFVRSRGNFARFGSASAKLRYVDAKGAQVGRTNSCTKVAKKKQAKSICCNSYHSREYSFVSSSLNKWWFEDSDFVLLLQFKDESKMLVQHLFFGVRMLFLIWELENKKVVLL